MRNDSEMVSPEQIIATLTDIQSFLASDLTEVALPNRLDSQRLFLLDTINREKIKLQNGFKVPSGGNISDGLNRTQDQRPNGKLENNDKNKIEKKSLLQSSSSLSSHSSGSSYASNSYTTNSYTSNCYSNSSNDCNLIQEDVYEEFDAAQMRGCQSSDNLLDSRNSPTTTNKSSSTTDTFFSNLRSSLSYNKKHKFTFRSSSKNCESPDRSSKSVDKSEEAANDEDTESVCNTEIDDDTYSYSVSPVPCSSLILCCEKHGILQKKYKTLIRTWRASHCVLSDGVLYLYAKDTDQRQRKSLVLGNYDVRVATSEELSQGRHLYLELVAPGKRTHTFMALSKLDRDEWLLALCHHTKNKKVAVETHQTSISGGLNSEGSFTLPRTLPSGVTSKSSNLPPTSNDAEETDMGNNYEESFEQDDTFSSDEVYEEMRIDPLRGDAGPSLSEMLEPHLFRHSTYYSVPPDSEDQTCKDIPDSPKQTTETLPRTKPARPPPPLQSKTPSKNMSALHTCPMLQQALTSSKDQLQATKSIDKDASSPSSSTPFNKFNRIFSPSNSAKRNLFGPTARPLPAAPPKDEFGDIYCVIEDDDHYEVNESNGSQLLQLLNLNYSPRAPLPPPLPIRGLPAVPNLDNLPPKPSTVQQSRPASQCDLLEDYDIPEDLHLINQAVNPTIVSDDPMVSSRIAPLPQDLSVVMPSYPLAPKRNEITQPPLPQKESTNSDEDDEVYKVPTSQCVEEFYQVPPSDPIPVENNNMMLTNMNVDKEIGLRRYTEQLSCELYQIPSPEAIPVSPAPSPSKKPAIESSSSPLATMSKRSLTPSNIPRPISNEMVRSKTLPGSKGAPAINVKARVAQINSRKEAILVQSPVKTVDDIVVMVGNQEIKLDQNKKKAFLESTLKFEKK